MPIPSNTGRDVYIVPLVSTYHRNYIPMEANSELPVLVPFYEGREVWSMPIVPAPQKLPEGNTKTVKPQVIDPYDFMRGGLNK